MTLITRRQFLQLTGTTLATTMMPAFAAEQSWPVRPIRAVVPFTAGSAIDTISRVIIDPMSTSLGQQIVIDNRGGAGGMIGASMVAHADPDGYTLLFHSSAYSLTPAIYPKADFDVLKDFVPVAPFGSIPNVTFMAATRGIKTLQQMVTFAKQEKRTFASSGVGSASHWAMERLRLSAGFDAVHVPFKTTPAAITEVLTGRVDFMSIGLPAVLPFIREGRAVALAVSTPKRASALPDVPTTLECGYPDSDYLFWNGMFVPAKTARPIIDRLYTELRKALELPAVKERLAPLGNEPMPMTPREYDALIRKEVASNLAVVRKANLKFD